MYNLLVSTLISHVYLRNSCYKLYMSLKRIANIRIAFIKWAAPKKYVTDPVKKKLEHD